MARKPKTLTVYERIEKAESEITSVERNLAYLKSQLEILYAEKDEIEMKEMWRIIKEKGMSMTDVQELIEKINHKNIQS